MGGECAKLACVNQLAALLGLAGFRAAAARLFLPGGPPQLARATEKLRSRARARDTRYADARTRAFRNGGAFLLIFPTHLLGTSSYSGATASPGEFSHRYRRGRARMCTREATPVRIRHFLIYARSGVFSMFVYNIDTYT